MAELESIFEKPVCSKGVEKESCLMYRTGNCCDYKEERKEKIKTLVEEQIRNSLRMF